MTEDLPEGAELITEEEAQELENTTTQAAETQEQTEPQPKQSKADLIRIEAKKFVESGANVSDTDTLNAECKRISELLDADYSQVQRLLKKECKIKPANQVVTVQADKNIFKVSNKEPLKRPAKISQTENDKGSQDLGKMKKLSQKELAESIDADLQLEADMIAMSLQALADFEGALSLPAPQQKKIDKMALMIATYNRKMVQSGHPEKVMNVSDRVAELMLKLGLASMFILPVVKKYFPQNKDGNSKTKKVKESMR